jgi:hypothetical protein
MAAPCEWQDQMRHLFEHILQTDDIKGLVLLTKDGGLVFHEFIDGAGHDLRGVTALAGAPGFAAAREVEFVYENDRIYMRMFPEGLVIVWMGAFAPVAMVRLTCDVLIPSLEKALSSKGWRRLFKGISAGS